MNISSRTRIFNKLHKEYRGRNNYTSPVFSFLKKPEIPLEKSLEEKIVGLNGKIFLCQSIIDFQEKFKIFITGLSFNEIHCNEENILALLPADIPVKNQFSENCDITITGCEYIVAQTGSVILSTSQTKSRKIFSFPTIHVVIAQKNQLIEELSEAIIKISEKYDDNFPSQITVITGPSRTADIEKTLIMGAHGPKDLIIFYIDKLF